MKDYINPALLVLVFGLSLCGFLVDNEALAAYAVRWGGVICVTMVVVDFALAVAAAIARRPSLRKALWGVGFVSLGCCLFLMPTGELNEADPAVQEFQEMWEAYRKDGDATAVNDGGDTLLVVAAGLGKRNVVNELLGKDPDPAMVARAMRRAAENGHLPVVKLLLTRVPVNDMTTGETPLISAVACGRHKVAQYLLENGADPNLKDASGTPPLHHAVMADSLKCVKLLLKHGADPNATDANGRNAASFSHDEGIDKQLAP